MGLRLCLFGIWPLCSARTGICQRAAGRPGCARAMALQGGGGAGREATQTPLGSGSSSGQQQGPPVVQQHQSPPVNTHSHYPVNSLHNAPPGLGGSDGGQGPGGPGGGPGSNAQTNNCLPPGSTPVQLKQEQPYGTLTSL